MPLLSTYENKKMDELPTDCKILMFHIIIYSCELRELGNIYEQSETLSVKFKDRIYSKINKILEKIKELKSLKCNLLDEDSLNEVIDKIGDLDYDKAYDYGSELAGYFANQTIFRKEMFTN